jgi:hypothetical protein
MAVAQLHMISRRVGNGTDDLQQILADPRQEAGDAAGLELVAGEIPGVQTRWTRPAGKREGFAAVQSRNPGTFAS